MCGMAMLLKTLDGKKHLIGETLSPIDCFRCGVCCERYQPRVTKKEIKAIAIYLDIAIDEFVLRYVQQVPVKEGFLLRRSEKGCIFLHIDEHDNRATCNIYTVRPKACRDWTASLSRLECREGLVRLKPDRMILTSKEMYDSQEAVNKLRGAVLSYRR
jgi:Fe-S-cluster containining protein